VLNGAQGLSDTLAQALSQGVAGLQMARNLLAGANGNGSSNGHGNGSSTNGAKALADGESGDSSDSADPSNTPAAD
jgi:hypothetical protein